MNHRKPKDLKELQGTARGDRPDPEGLVPDPVEIDELELHFPAPSFFSAPAKNKWRELVVILNEKGLLDKLDRGSLEMCCTHYADYQEAERDIKRLKKDLRKMEKENPIDEKELKSRLKVIELKTKLIGHYIGIRNTASRLYSGYMKEFGLSPASRAKIPVKKKPDGKSEFEKYKDRLEGAG